MSLSAEQLRRFADAIEHRLGVRVGDRPVAVARIVERRAAAHRSTAGDYLDRLDRVDAAELRALAAEVTVGETYFFRHVEQFSAYADLLPELLVRRGRVRVLSAGCSSGEEPYTLAILARERVPDPAAVEIHAIDVNPEALARARRGHYPRWALRATSAEHEARWFTADGTGVVLSARIRDAVQFGEANLLDDAAAWAGPGWDLVFCRNVLMYLGEPTLGRVLDRLTRAIEPGGYLFVGHAELVRRPDRLGLELCHTHNTFYYRRGQAPGSGSASIERPALVASSPAPPPLAVADDRWAGDIAAASARVASGVARALAPAAAGAAAAAPDDPLAGIRALVRHERFADAVARLAQLPPSIAAGADAVLLRAVVATQTGDAGEARSRCRALLDAGEHAASAHYLLAICDDAAGNPAGSQRHAVEALALDPAFAMATMQLGLLARRRRDRAAAVEHLARALDLLAGQDAATIELLGGGFSRAVLVELCRSELDAARAGR